MAGIQYHVPGGNRYVQQSCAARCWVHPESEGGRQRSANTQGHTATREGKQRMQRGQCLLSGKRKRHVRRQYHREMADRVGSRVFLSGFVSAGVLRPLHRYCCSCLIPGRSATSREIQRKSPYEIMVARYGKRCAEIEFRASSCQLGCTEGHVPARVFLVGLGRPCYHHIVPTKRARYPVEARDRLQFGFVEHEGSFNNQIS